MGRKQEKAQQRKTYQDSFKGVNTSRRTLNPQEGRGSFWASSFWEGNTVRNGPPIHHRGDFNI